MPIDFTCPHLLLDLLVDASIYALMAALVLASGIALVFLHDSVLYLRNTWFKSYLPR